MFNSLIKSETQQIFLPVLEGKKVTLFIKREDKIHPFVSGNKFRKLKYNIQEAKKEKQKTLLTFGGAYSNHILATAVAGNLAGLKTTGVIRGDELATDFEKTLASNSTLQQAQENGMQFQDWFDVLLHGLPWLLLLISALLNINSKAKKEV